VRLDALNFLMSRGPATASECARAVGDTPSNCSYHLRVLARHGLVEREPSSDGRERPWRALVTGFTTSREGIDHDPGAAVLAASLQLDQRLVREYLTHRDRAPAGWREADAYAAYTLSATPEELTELVAQLDALIRPLIAATRGDAPENAELVNLGLYAFPRLEPGWRPS
jgi:DNA-binding MarR family transcriptional regulator